MKVILLDNIKGVGMVGDLKDVSDGYARNFLMPRKLAKMATPQAAQEVAKIRERKLTEIKLAEENAQKIADQLKNLKLVIKGKANEQGTLFDGIEAKDITHQIKEALGISLKDDVVQLEEHIKHLGTHIIKLQLTDILSTDITLEIEAL